MHRGAQPCGVDFPRAVGLDDEALRTFQATDLAEDMLQDMTQECAHAHVHGRQKVLCEILPSTREYGWFRRNLFSQPLGEETLRRGLKRFPHVELQLGVELVGLTQDEAGVTATLRDLQGEKTESTSELLGGERW